MTNYLRTKKVTLEDKELTVKEFSIASQVRMEGLEKTTFDDVFKESFTKEDYEWYSENKENIPRWFLAEINDAIKEVNERPKFLPPIKSDVKNFRENTDGNKTVESVDEPTVLP